MKLDYIILAFITAILLYFLSDYLFDKVTHRYYADIPVMRAWERRNEKHER